MELSKLLTEIFVYYLDNIKPVIFKSIFDANELIIRSLGPISAELPLWMITGGESINYYSSDTDKTPTKDIDCKLLFTGAYNIPKELFQNVPQIISSIKGFIKKEYKGILTPNGFDFQSQQFGLFINHNATQLETAFNSHFGAYIPFISAGLTSRNNLLWSFMTGSGKNIAGNLLFVDPNNNNALEALEIDQIDNHARHNPNWNTSDIDLNNGEGVRRLTYKIYIVKTPYLYTGDKTQSFPYGLDHQDKINEISDTELSIIQQKLNAFYSNNPEQIWTEYYRLVSLMNQGRYLFSLVGVCILVDQRTGIKYVLQEGILDLFIDFSASQSKAGKYIYENKSDTGMIPNIIKEVDYCGKKGYVRIPTLNWLIYDQTRMLYHSLRLQEVGHHGWTDNGVAPNGWKPFADGKQKKYFSKLKGLVNTFLQVITRIETVYMEDKPNVVDVLQNCTNETECMPSDFLSYVYSAVVPVEFISKDAEIVICQSGGRGGKSHKRKTRKTRKQEKNFR
jgi:hypothetical protein